MSDMSWHSLMTLLTFPSKSISSTISEFGHSVKLKLVFVLLCFVLFPSFYFLRVVDVLYLSCVATQYWFGNF